MVGKNRIMILRPERRRHLRRRIQDSRRRGAGDLDPEDGDCGDPAFSGANVVWIVRAGYERHLIKEVGTRACNCAGRVVAGREAIEVARVRITEAGRQILAGVRK